MVGKLSTSSAPAAAGDINRLVELVLAQLPPDAPFMGPKHIAPLLGLTAHGFAKHCRTCRATRAWRGSYRFQLEDPAHREALVCVIKLVLWSGRKLPAYLRTGAASPRTSPADMAGLGVRFVPGGSRRLADTLV